MVVVVKPPRGRLVGLLPSAVTTTAAAVWCPVAVALLAPGALPGEILAPPQMGVRVPRAYPAVMQRYRVSGVPWG